MSEGITMFESLKLRDKIRNARKEKRISQEQLGSSIGAPKQAISLI